MSRTFIAVFSIVFLCSCADNKPQIAPVPERVNVYPQLPVQACPDEPILPAGVKQDTELANWTEAVRHAGADCRSVVKATKKVVDGWPSN